MVSGSATAVPSSAAGRTPGPSRGSLWPGPMLCPRAAPPRPRAVPTGCAPQAPCCAHGLCPPSRGPMPRQPLSAPAAGSMRHEIPPWRRESGSYRSPPAASSSAAGARQPSASSQKEEAGAHHCSGRARDFGFGADQKCCGGIVIRRLF